MNELESSLAEILLKEAAAEKVVAKRSEIIVQYVQLTQAFRMRAETEKPERTTLSKT